MSSIERARIATTECGPCGASAPWLAPGSCGDSAATAARPTASLTGSGARVDAEARRLVPNDARGDGSAELGRRRARGDAGPGPRLLVAPTGAPTLRDVAERWRGVAIDVAEGTRRDASRQPRADSRPCSVTGASATITPTDVAESRRANSPPNGLARETIRKTLATLAMVLDFAGVAPNPARDKHGEAAARGAARDQPSDRRARARRPRALAAAVPAAAARPRRDRHAGRRARAAHVGRHRRARGALARLAGGREDRTRALGRRTRAAVRGRARRLCRATTASRRGACLPGRHGDRFRTAIARACTAAGVPAFSPHDLRHRRISLLHLGGVPWARIGEHVGQRNLAVTANTYTHVLVDESEIDYAVLTGR